MNDSRISCALIQLCSGASPCRSVLKSGVRYAVASARFVMYLCRARLPSAVTHFSLPLGVRFCCRLVPCSGRYRPSLVSSPRNNWCFLIPAGHLILAPQVSKVLPFSLSHVEAESIPKGVSADPLARSNCSRYGSEVGSPSGPSLPPRRSGKMQPSRHPGGAAGPRKASALHSERAETTSLIRFPTSRDRWA